MVRPNVLISLFEHPSLAKPAFLAAQRGAINLEIIDANDRGNLALDVEKVQSADVVIVCQAHNETGIVPDFTEILSHVKPEALVMSDVAQGLSRLNPLPLRVDVMTFSAQKVGGFPGVGALIMRGNGKKLPPPWSGGGQERGFRPGTESVPLIAAFGAAASLVSAERVRNAALAPLRDYFEEILLQNMHLKIIGKETFRLPNTSALCFFKEDPDALRIACDMAGLSVGFGAACSGLAPEGSFALKRLMLSLAEEKSTVRFSLPNTITKNDIDLVIQRMLKYCIKSIYSR